MHVEHPFVCGRSAIACCIATNSRYTLFHCAPPCAHPVVSSTLPIGGVSRELQSSGLFSLRVRTGAAATLGFAPKGQLLGCPGSRRWCRCCLGSVVRHAVRRGRCLDQWLLSHRSRGSRAQCSANSIRRSCLHEPRFVHASKTALANSGYNSSRIGFRGTEDLGGGLAASFWLEAPITNDDGATGSRHLQSSVDRQPVGRLRRSPPRP